MRIKKYFTIFLSALVITLVSLFVLSKLSPSVGPKVETPEGPVMVRMYFIKLEDNGAVGEQVGCGDSVIPVAQEVVMTKDPIHSTVSQLIAIKDQNIGDEQLYNALAQSNLSVEKVEIRDRTAQVYLTGEIRLGGVCDTPRVQAQLEKTVLQFPNVENTTIYINGEELSSALSEK